MPAEVLVNPASQGVVAGLKPLLLLVGLAAAVAAGVGAALWSQGPTYNLLYGNLAGDDAAQITQVLGGAGIEYKLENGGATIAVPAEKVADARLLLAGQGLPSTGGFASMTRDSGFGLSQFMEGARYQHALETELAQTISSLQPVSAARVHIAASRQSAFVRDRQPPSASVFLQLRSGGRLSGEQISAITHLVASSVPELTSEQVTVVDQQGRLLSSPQGHDDAALHQQQLELSRQVEEEYAQRVESLLAPLVGPGRVRAQVVAQFDMSAVEEAREQYRPDSQIVRSEQTSEEQSANGAGGPRGVPGSLSNQPPDAGVALPASAGASLAAAKVPATGPAAADGTAAAVTPGNSAKQATRNFEIDRTVAYTRQPGGRLKRLSVAVLIDNARTAGKDGKVAERAMTDKELERITSLVKDAVGFDQSRGDSVNVMNAAWSGEPIANGAIEATAIPIWEKAWVQQLVKILAGLIIVIVLVFMVVKPTLNQLLAPLKPAPAPKALPGQQGGADAGGAVASGGGGAAAANPGNNNTLAYEQQLAQARTLVTQDPARVAQVVKGWVANDA
jgi:flagellar M-ring protein FliF